jgi:hypothetical protein
MTEKLKYVRRSSNVFIDLGFDRVEAENPAEQLPDPD